MHIITEGGITRKKQLLSLRCSGSSVGALTYPQQPAKKLGTPPIKDRESGAAPKVPLLRLGALSSAAAPSTSAAAGSGANENAMQQLVS